MKLRLLFSTLLCSFLLAAAGQAQSVGLIGSATPTGWDSDTDMVQDQDSSHLWSLVIDLIPGAAKFRQDDAWTVNWGDDEFPYGIGTQDGPDIPIPEAGEYTVTFNSNTGAYNFSVTSDIGIIGSATHGGWNEDTNLFQDQTDTNRYFITLRLLQGEAKFRANDDWAINWGALDFPSGIGTQNGPNIPIPAAGKYIVEFNKSTGAYSFTEILEFNPISLNGSATGDVDFDLVRSGSNPDLWSGNVTLTDGTLRFRANHAWTLVWGSTTFPTGTGVLGSTDEIPVTAGEYLVNFNTSTYVYEFLPVVIYATVGIIGDATPGGWNTDTDMMQDPNDPAIWRLRLVLKTGDTKFRADNDWAVNWGGGDFPPGTAVLDGPNIPIDTGEYNITFNSTTGAYNFELLVIYATVGIIGTATPLATWDTDVDMTKDAVDESFWYINSIEMLDGEAKFRAEDAWTVNWGATDWPTGFGTQDGPNIPVTAGTYRVTLNSATGEYAFADPLATQDILKSHLIAISPNPAKDVLNIELKADELKGEVRVMLFNNAGAQVLSQTLNIQDMAKINVANLVPGIYHLQLSNGKYIVGKPVVIVK